ncbi:hypothetical protein N7466_010791 [Penicillium verhagenii]|uniref:uncharacterized protein n=1 Tax=Penicillium verhagenii TaxID=1562060 RepID=UPI00254513C0|nr:uncharacterized protein N7466_010791 [Penicillium verhagenii]KAJ5917237.1 hypothetical protein N7466_010791 [Penicillium verhagenii]
MDHGELSEPALGAQRRLDLLDMAEYRFGFGADLEVDSDSVLQSEITTSWLRNRWPRVVIQEEKKWKLVQQWVVCNGVVIQQLVLQNLQDEDLKIECPVRLNILIRDTNFVDTTREFNKEGDDKHEEGSGPGGYGFVKIHALSQGQENTNEDSDAVAAVIGLFINGEAIAKDEFEVGITRRIPKHGQFQLVCGYKLVFLPHDNLEWGRLVLNSQDVDIDKFLTETQYKDDIPKNHFLFDREFFIGRNVEHILSVCMIPTTDRSEAGEDGATMENDTIALTCGDMSGHRVCVSASL